MQLREIIEHLTKDSAALCIVAKRPWTPASEARLISLTAEYRVPSDVLEQGYEYFLEAAVALEEVLNGLEHVLSAEQRFNAVLYYAENDAYPEWLCVIRDEANG